MGIAARTWSAWRAFLVGLSAGALCVYFALSVVAATGIITVDGNGSVNNGTPQSGCSALPNYQCVDSVSSTSSTPTGEFLRQSSGNVDEFTLTSLTGVDEVSEVRVWVYHIENSANMTLSVELWNATGSVQYGATTNFTNRSISGWDPAYFTTTNFPLSGQQLDGLRVRLSCTKGPGKGTDCDTYAVLADVVYTEVVDVTVSSVGSQQNLDVGVPNQHVGGAFVISEDTGSRNITSITIQEQGSVDAQADLSNVRLYYELASDCSVATYNGNETQFGATTTFNGADGTATFTDSVAVTTANDMCVYTVLDVDDTAGTAETLEIQITDPSTQVQGVVAPNVSPNTPVAISGQTTLQKVDLTQIHYHWRDDNGDETGAGSLTSGNEDNTLDNAGVGTIYRVRMEVTNEGNATSPATAFGLEYATKVTSCSAITNDNDWMAVSASGGDWDMAGVGSGLSDGDTQNISNTIGGVSDVGTNFVGTGGERETTGTTSAVALAADDFYEMEFAIEAQGSASPGTTYCFRVSNNGTSIGTYDPDAYPEATIAADLLVTASTTAQVQAMIPEDNVYGGGFVITDATAGTHSINSVTLTAVGTVDLQNHINDITLWYESDTVAPLDCTGESFDGDETLYGSVDTDGFSVNGTSTFTAGTAPTVSNGNNALCFYVEFDVTASSSDGETIEVRLANAATDIVVDTGSVSPAALVDFNGDTTMVRPIVTQEHYHWRDNSGTSTSAASLTGGEDLVYDELPTLTTTRLRFGVSNTGGTTTSAYQYQLEWAQRLTTCGQATGWVNVDTAADEWQMVSSQLVDNADTYDISNSIGGVTNVGTFLTPNGGQQDVDDITGNITLDSGEFVELEYSIQATNLATEGSSYCFRLTNAGTPLDAYDNYARAVIKLGTDYKIQRNSAVIQAGNTSVTITAGSQYDTPSSASNAFIRIINNAYTGRGPETGVSGNAASADVTAYISNPGNIMSSITFTRAGTSNDTYIEWEIIEYIGDPGGENEMIVRGVGVATYGTLTTDLTVTTGAVSGIVNDNDVVPYITGQGNPDGGRFNYNTGLSTAAWNAGSDTATFTRGESGSDAVNVSYAIVEFTGTNWKVQRAEMNYDSNYIAGNPTTTPITSVNSPSRAFLHAQHRAGAGEDQHADFGHEVWLSGIGEVSFRLNGAVQTPTLHTSVAWIVENTQTVGDVMVVTRKGSSIPADGGGLTSTNVNIGKTVDDLSVTSMTLSAASDGAVRTFPEPIISGQLISDTQFNLQVTDDADTIYYQVEVIEWPTAARKLVQANYWIYEDNDSLTPSTAWHGGALGENAEMTENTSPMAFGDSARIRINLEVTAAAMPAGVDAFLLEYAVNPGSCSAAGPWQLLGDTTSSTALWRGHAGTPADGTTVSSLLLGASTVAGTYEEDNPTALTPNLALVGDFVEFDWNVEHNGAADKTSYCFRMVNGDRSPFVGGSNNGYDVFPVLRTVGYGPEIWNWRWYDDEGSATPSVPLSGAAENAAPSDVANDNIITLRVVLAEKQGATGVNTKFALQFSEYADFQEVYNVVSSSTCAKKATTTAQLWCYDNGAGDDNDLIPSTVITGADTCPAGCGTRNEATTTASSFNHTAFSNAEFEFTIRNNGARANAVYYFRLYDLVNDEVVVASTSYPSLQVEGAQLVFSVSGLPAGTETEGITADVTTTATSVPFGSVPLNTEYEAAYRFTIDTNATEGYQLFMYVTQPLLNVYGSPIDVITGTNAAPVSWSSGCLSTAIGCFGYHSGDDVLAGGSTRFAADDTYAAPSTTPHEIMYSSVPTEDTVDIIYKLQVGDLQPAGQYETEIVYIVVPQF